MIALFKGKRRGVWPDCVTCTGVSQSISRGRRAEYFLVLGLLHEEMEVVIGKTYPSPVHFYQVPRKSAVV